MNCLHIVEIRPLSSLCLQILSPILRAVLFITIIYLLFCCVKVFKFPQDLFVYFCYYTYHSKRWSGKDIARIYVKKQSKFFSNNLQCTVLNISLSFTFSLFLCIVLGCILISFTCSYAFFFFLLTPIILLYILASFAID